MASWSDPITPVFSIIDGASTTDSSRGATGIYTKTDSSTLDITLNQSIASGFGLVIYDLNVGSTQTFGGGTPTWVVHKFGGATSGGLLQKADGTAYAVADLSTATPASFRSVIALCSDGVRVCNATAWETFANAD